MQEDHAMVHEERPDVKRRRIETIVQSSDARHHFGEPSGLISSWLRNVAWVRKQGGNQGSMQLYSSDHLLMETNVLSRQLLQVKRRLGPVAEKCAAQSGGETTSQIEFVEARRAGNPYEFLGEGQMGGLNELFMNRSAIKLANIDALLGFHLTSGCENLLFADLCGAPGGFSEYVMRRCIHSGMSSCTGYGMSLIGSNENGHGLQWKLDNFSHSEGGTQVNYRVCLGSDGTGDILNWGNVEALQGMIKQDAHPNRDDKPGESSGKVQLVLADGGIDAQRDAEDQEGMTQKIIVCQVSAALGLLQKGGTLVVKMFGFQTSVVQSVLRYLFSTFDSMVAVKPISSRPASAERYVICAGFKGSPKGWNGPRWRNRMFLGNIGGESLQLERYLAEFDRDMLALNLKACHAILSYMEAKSVNPSGQNFPNHLWEVRAGADVDDYKLAWHLV